MNVSPPLAAARLEVPGRTVNAAGSATPAPAATAETDAVKLSSLARYTVKGNPAARDRLPASARRSFSGVDADPSVSEPAKSLLFFNLVLCPVSEARRGSALERMAANVHMSARQFTRVFRSEKGTTPARFVERMRVEVARSLLEASGVGVKSVAAKCGFGSADSMRRSFLRVVDTTPSGIAGANRTPGTVRGP